MLDDKEPILNQLEDDNEDSTAEAIEENVFLHRSKTRVRATPRVHKAFVNSLFLALVGATVCMILASLASYITVRTKIAARGRHDPCVLPRAVPMVEAMTALVLCDHALRQRAVDLSNPAK